MISFSMEVKQQKQLLVMIADVMAVVKYYISVHCTLETGSFYNNLSLAHCLVENKTHLVKSLRQNVNKCALGCAAEH